MNWRKLLPWFGSRPGRNIEYATYSFVRRGPPIESTDAAIKRLGLKALQLAVEEMEYRKKEREGSGEDNND